MYSPFMLSLITLRHTCFRLVGFPCLHFYPVTNVLPACRVSYCVVLFLIVPAWIFFSKRHSLFINHQNHQKSDVLDHDQKHAQLGKFCRKKNLQGKDAQHDEDSFQDKLQNVLVVGMCRSSCVGRTHPNKKNPGDRTLCHGETCLWVDLNATYID